MNIFYTSPNSILCARHHANRHCVKMIIEYAQLLSTAHRVLDGTETGALTASGRKKKVWVLNDKRDTVLYLATHVQHPSAVWVRQSASNYIWLYSLLTELCKEYTHRYGKIHKCERIGLLDMLRVVPTNISNNKFTEPTPAMPDVYKVTGNSIQSYINYINSAKQHLHEWKNREVPYFIKETLHAPI